MRARITSFVTIGLIVMTAMLSMHDVSATPYHSGLENFFHDLSRLETGKINQINILQIGDSHTAADFFSGRLRFRLQDRFGNGGRGMMPPGVAFHGLDQRQMTFSQDKNWVIENSLKSPNLGPYGISGFVARSRRAGARIALTANTADDNFDWVSVDYLKRPGGGKFRVQINEKIVASVPTAGPVGRTGHFLIRNMPGSTELQIIAGASNIAITAWGVGRLNHGIVLTSHGVVSASADIFTHWSPAIVESDIANLHPSLIILAYGTNESADSDFKPNQYRQTFMNMLTTLKRFAPNASILVIGPPDSERIDPSCSRAKTEPSACSWQTQPALAAVRTIQSESAARTGAAFWNWSSAMPDGIASWVDRDLARSDHVHFTHAGYEMAADELFEALMTEYAASQEHSRTR